jgi:hypothetical protein
LRPPESTASLLANEAFARRIANACSAWSARARRIAEPQTKRLPAAGESGMASLGSPPQGLGSPRGQHRAFVQLNLEKFLKEAMAALAKARPPEPVAWLAQCFVDGQIPAACAPPDRSADRAPFLEYIGTETIGMVARSIAKCAREEPEQPLLRMGQLLMESTTSPALAAAARTNTLARVGQASVSDAATPPPAAPSTPRTSGPPEGQPPAASPHATALSELADDVAGLLGESGRQALAEAKANTPRSTRSRALSFKQQADMVEELKKEAHALLTSPQQRGRAEEFQQLSLDAASSLTSEAALTAARAEQSAARRQPQTPREMAAQVTQMTQHANDLSSSASLHHLAQDAAELLGAGGADALQQAQLDTPRKDPAELGREISQAQDEVDALLRG